MESESFRYVIDSFADIKIMRYRIDGWENLTLKQKTFIYYLSEAAKRGRDIIWDQNCRFNLQVRHVLESILNNYQGWREGDEWEKFLTYAKRVFFSNGIHHHYALDKILPECSQQYFENLMDESGLAELKKDIIPVIFDPSICPIRQYVGTDRDIVLDEEGRPEILRLQEPRKGRCQEQADKEGGNHECGTARLRSDQVADRQ